MKTSREREGEREKIPKWRYLSALSSSHIALNIPYEFQIQRRRNSSINYELAYDRVALLGQFAWEQRTEKKISLLIYCFEREIKYRLRKQLKYIYTLDVVVLRNNPV